MAVTVAGMALQETRLAEQDGDLLRVAGKHGWQVWPQAQIEAVHGNITALRPDNGPDRVVPVVFDDKTSLTGFYRVEAAASSLTRYADGAVEHALWALTLKRIGSGADVEVESYVPTINRSTELGGTSASYWHAPAGNTQIYYTGASTPSSTVTRQSADGPIVVYLGIPLNFAPQWTTSAADYLKGSVRLTADGQRRLGGMTPAGAWQVDNGLVRITPSAAAGGFEVACWADGGWESAKSYRPTIGGGALSNVPEFTVLRNDPEEVTFRLSYVTSAGRTQVDMSLRRGSRFATGVIKRHASATLGITRTAAESSSTQTGGVMATNADADGNRFFIGSTRTVTTTTATASISKAAVSSLDFFIGHQVASTPQTGDAYASLLNQYRGTNGERAQIVRR